jgi:hypothetical protein
MWWDLKTYECDCFIDINKTHIVRYSAICGVEPGDTDGSKIHLKSGSPMFIPGKDPQDIYDLIKAAMDEMGVLNKDKEKQDDQTRTD